MSTVIPFPSMGRKPAGPACPPAGLYQEFTQQIPPPAIDHQSSEIGDGVLDIRETAAGLDMECQFPSFDAEDVKVSLSGNILTIRAEKEAAHNRWIGNGRLRERCHSRFSQRVTLPYTPDAANLSSDFADGVLHISVPRRR